MNRNRLMIGLALAIVVASLVSTFVYREFKRASASAPPVQMQHIVVAAKPLQLGTRLESSGLRLISWPAGQPMQGMITRIEDCNNRALITPVAENEPILEDKLAPVEAGAGLSATIPQGMRAISVAVNEVVGVAGFVTPGTMVDVLVTGAISGANASGGSSVTRTILENVRVLAAGQKIEQGEGKPQTVPVITLLVTPEDAATLAMASNQGKIQLALRNTVDTQTTNPPAVLQSALFGGVAPPILAKPAVTRRSFAPPPPEPAPYAVEVITGSKREIKNFPNP
jgi:pilus assembly protein CpaB